MRKQTLPLLLALSGIFSTISAQVGVNTVTPAATLDVTAKNATGSTANVDGLLLPRVDRLRAQSMVSVPTSTLIYVNNVGTGSQTGVTANVDTVGYYYFDGSVWIKLKTGATTDVNIYNSDGTLAGNRIVTQGTNTLAFTSNAVNGFSVDGSTLSVDALNNRIGIGTAAPNGQLELGQTVANRKIVLYGSFNNDHQFYGLGVNSGVLRFQTDGPGSDHVFYAGTSATTSNELFRIRGTGNVGVGTSTPQNKLHVNGNLQVTNELNVGGNATTAGSAGTIGQILTSGGAGAAPSWVNASSASVNIYNADGTLTGNRVVTQGANTLAFNGSAVNAFSVNGTTLSVDGTNNRVGIGTTAPVTNLDITAGTSIGTSTSVEGLLIPRVNRQRAQSMTGVPTSTLIYVMGVVAGSQTGTAINMDTVGYYYFNGSVWVKLKSTDTPDVNIYSSDGTLAGNRVVTQGTNTLAFTSNAVNGFSVDGTTFSVDGLNNRLGIGTSAPTNSLTIVDPTNANQFQGTASILSNNLTQGVGIGWNGIQSVGTNTNADLSLNAKGTGNVVLQTQSTGNVGINASTPTNTLDVNGTTRVRTMSVATPGTILSPVYADPNGVLVKSSVSSTYGNFSSNSNSITSGSTGTLVTGLVDGIYKVTVVVFNLCNDAATVDFYVHNETANSFFGLNGKDGFATSATATSNHPTFNQSVRTSIGVSWTGIAACTAGGDGTGFNYTLTMPSAGTINVTNNGNATRNYRATFTRID